MGVGGGELTHQPRRVVRAAVVDEQQVDAVIGERRGHRVHPIMQTGEVLLLVEAGHDDHDATHVVNRTGRMRLPSATRACVHECA